MVYRVEMTTKLRGTHPSSSREEWKIDFAEGISPQELMWLASHVAACQPDLSGLHGLSPGSDDTDDCRGGSLVLNPDVVWVFGQSGSGRKRETLRNIGYTVRL